MFFSALMSPDIGSYANFVARWSGRGKGVIRRTDRKREDVASSTHTAACEAMKYSPYKDRLPALAPPNPVPNIGLTAKRSRCSPPP